MAYSLTWLHNAPSPNQIEFFQQLGKTPGVRLRVLHCCAEFPTRPFPLGAPWLVEDYAFEHRILSGLRLPLGQRREFYINPEVLRLISRSS